MAKVTTTITDKQSGKTQFPNGIIIPQPILNKPSAASVWSATGPRPADMPQKLKYTILDQEGKTVATLIDQSQAEKWVADHKRGATRFVQGVQSLIV
jgi:hypothetical protein